jgi:uncharacterized membrane protein YbhN (UPF0104 family)
VINKIDVRETKEILFHAHVLWLFLALLFFNISKIISAFRLNGFFKEMGLLLESRYNIRLYYVGMFYNLFLPGGIGGDGYKVYLLNKFFKSPVRQLISATLLDRISGLIALIFLVFIFSYFINLSILGEWINWLISGLLLLTYPVYYVFYRLLFKRFSAVFIKSNIQSLGVQMSQVISALFIMWALDVHQYYFEYLFLFLLSSVVAVLPFTIGGVGARELVFIFGANYLMIDMNTAVAFSLLFFLLTALSSFTGIFLETSLKRST